MKLVSIEGIDGSGKTTFINNIKKLIRDKQFKGRLGKYKVIKFPSKYFFEQIKKYKGTEYLSESYIEYLQDQDKLKTLTDLEDKGYEIVISDRCEVTQKVYNGSVNTSVKSDLVIYLDISSKTAIKRIQNRGKDDNLGYEREDVLSKLRDRYHRVLQSDEYKDKTIWLNTKEKDIRDLEEVKRFMCKIIKGCKY